MLGTLRPASLKVCVNALIIVACGSILADAVQAQVTEPIPPPTTPNTVVDNMNSASGYVRAKASPDECWIAPGQNTRWNFLNLGNGSSCKGNAIPKINQGYIWGQVLVNNQIFFGTFSNPECLGVALTNSNPDPVYQFTAWTCEYGQSPYSTTNGGLLPPALGDFRPPRMYIYDIPSQTIRDITPKLGGTPPASVCGQTGTNPLCVDDLWWKTMVGVRSATSYVEPTTNNTYVIVSGQAFVKAGTPQNASNFFVWGVTENRWVGKYQLVGAADVRNYINYQGVLYAAAFKPSPTGGALLRYIGNMKVIPPSAPSDQNGYNAIPLCGPPQPVTGPPVAGAPACIAFQVVGNFDTPASAVAVAPAGTPDAGRLFVGTWPPNGTNPNNAVAGIYMSPVIPASGLTAANANSWTKVWNAGNYDPDPLIKTSYGVGGMAFYNGYLYWGTLNPPLSGPNKIFLKYGQPTDQSTLTEDVLKGNRTAVLFRGQGFSSASPSVDLLYGEGALPVFTPPTDTTAGSWQVQPNNVPSGDCTSACGTRPLYGQSGFNHLMTNYMWSMAVIGSRLYVGTMDWGYIAYQNIVAGSNGPASMFFPQPADLGGGLYYFADSDHGVTAISTTGVGNFLNYGIRSIIPYSPSAFFVGTANPMSIATHGSTNVPGAACAVHGQCRGGWELVEIDPTQ